MISASSVFQQSKAGTEGDDDIARKRFAAFSAMPLAEWSWDFLGGDV